MNSIVSLDLGTSALKAIRFGDDGTILSSRSRPVSTHGSGGRREQDPDEWWAAATELLGETLNEGPTGAIALSGTMQNLIPTGADGSAAGPAILYSDARVTAERRRELERRLPADLPARIGNRPDNAQPVFKLMEAAGPRPDHWHFGAKDVLIERLTGERVVDPTVATTTGLMDVRTRDWDDELLDAAGLPRAALPAIVPGDRTVGRTGGEWVERAGLPAGVPVVCGAGDAGASAWGAGAEGDGGTHLYVGTSGWVALALERVPDDLPRDTYVLAMPTGGGALQIAPVITAGAAIEWAAATTGRGVAEAFEAVRERGVRPDGPLFLPYLHGERSPFEDGAVRGAFLNLDASHGPDDLFVAALEGVGHALRHCAEALGARASGITAIGGAFRAAAMVRIVATAFGAPIRVAPHPAEATAFGAARLARRALGLNDFPARPARATQHGDDDRRESEGASRRYGAYRHASGQLRELAGLLGGDRSP